MKRFYSLFVTNDTLLASPYINQFNIRHDLTLQCGVPETVNFLLQTPLTAHQFAQLQVLYDPLQLCFKLIDMKSFKHQSLITVEIIPKELGTVRIGFAFPETRQQGSDSPKAIATPLPAMA